jgi:hypothetical protein
MLVIAIAFVQCAIIFFKKDLFLNLEKRCRLLLVQTSVPAFSTRQMKIQRIPGEFDAWFLRETVGPTHWNGGLL